VCRSPDAVLYIVFDHKPEVADVPPGVHVSDRQSLQFSKLVQTGSEAL